MDMKLGMQIGEYSGNKSVHPMDRHLSRDPRTCTDAHSNGFAYVVGVGVCLCALACCVCNWGTAAQYILVIQVFALTLREKVEELL